MHTKDVTKEIRDIKADLERAHLQTKVYVDLVSSNSKMSKKQFEIFITAQHWFDGDKALEMGIIDEIYGKSGDPEEEW